MIAKNQESVTFWLQAAARDQDSDHAKTKLFEATYDVLRRLADQMMARQSPMHFLQPTELVNEAALRLMGGQSLSQIANSKHFFSTTAKAMRCVLVDYARKRKCSRHGGHFARMNIDIVLEDMESSSRLDMIELDEALTKLGKSNPRHAELVQMRFFLGMTVKEIAADRNVSLTTVERDWRFVRAWLADELRR